MNYQQAKAKLMKNPEFKKAYEKADLAFEISTAVIDMRIAAGINQEEVARKVGTSQSGIARLENGNNLPSLSFLQRVAEALGYEVEVRFKKI